MGIDHRPLYSKQDEFPGGPTIMVADETGKNRPIEQRDYEKKPFDASESRDSEEVTSVHKVLDLGFGAAANGIPTSLHNFSDIDLLQRDAFAALEDYRNSHQDSGLKQATACTCIESELRAKVNGGLQWSKFDKKEYLPINVFEQTITTKSIISIWAEKKPKATDDELWSMFTSIFDPEKQKSRRRILGILVLMKCFELINDFIRAEVWDDGLPFKYPGSHDETPQLMQRWDRNDVLLFYSYQKMFFVPFFNIQDHRLLSYDLNRDIRLPWQHFEYKTSGGTGMVHQVVIHPNHHNFRRPGVVIPIFALKEIDAMDRKAYNEELSALEKTCAQVQKEKHLIQLLLTFRHGEKFYLLFEWADGNLEKFWETEPATPLTDRWAAEQCRGLAQAVSRIHGLRTWQKRRRTGAAAYLSDIEREWGRHGDIKPENILWFKEHKGDHNLLVISDLGLTRYHTEFSRSLVHRSQIDGCTRAYRPPEMDMGRDITQAYDIWSLGCVFLEFCIWFQQGYSAIELFAVERQDNDDCTIDNMQEDNFFVMKGEVNDGRIPELKTCVTKRISELREKSSTFTNGLLNVIEHKMLCCDPGKRSPIDKICIDLLHVLDSLPKATTAEEVSRNVAYAVGESPTRYSLSLSDIDISQDEVSNRTFESPRTSVTNERDAVAAMSTKSGASKKRNIEQDTEDDEFRVLEERSEAPALETIDASTATATFQDNPATVPFRPTAQLNSTPPSVVDRQPPPTNVKHHRRHKLKNLFRRAQNVVHFWSKPGAANTTPR
ncbi:kinase-like protein [Ophiobolus disseminans]|uniref:Kinase-like protein n=1 Tax=Ophiobolus disseminans TaxID=1469910 RepID=A0A6A6ZLI7_9PLEO|nr:kinase-like protein [Ophiobolus disseminans]